MLILTRKIGETIKIGDDIQVAVLGVKGNQVRLGVDAPREVSVHREEIYEKILEEESEEPVVHRKRTKFIPSDGKALRDRHVEHLAAK